jgi:hypothetical protein
VLWPIQLLTFLSAITTFLNYLNVNSLEELIMIENTFLHKEGISLETLLKLEKRFSFVELIENRFDNFYHFRFKGLNIFIAPEDEGGYSKRVVADDKTSSISFDEFISSVNQMRKDKEGTQVDPLLDLLTKVFGDDAEFKVIGNYPQNNNEEKKD